MTMSPGLRKIALTAHVVTSVGWIGAVAVFLVLAIIGLASPDAQFIQAIYRVLEPISWFVIVPFSLASVLTGFISSLGTILGLFRHYWIVIKLFITIPATLLLLVHLRPISYVADAAARNTFASTDLADLRLQLLIQSGAGLVVLLIATVLSVYKPRGRTRYGRRKLREQRQASQQLST